MENVKLGAFYFSSHSFKVFAVAHGDVDLPTSTFGLWIDICIMQPLPPRYVSMNRVLGLKTFFAISAQLISRHLADFEGSPCNEFDVSYVTDSHEAAPHSNE